MELSQFIKEVLEESKAQEISFEVKLNHLAMVDDNGANKIKFTLYKKQ